MDHTTTPPFTVPALAEYLAQLPEYRAARGTQHPLLALLLLVCVATLCGARSQPALADRGRHHGRPWLRRLGFTKERAPSQPTLSRLFQRLPHRTVEAVLGRWAEQALRCCPLAAGGLEGSRWMARPCVVASGAGPRTPTCWPPSAETPAPERAGVCR